MQCNLLESPISINYFLNKNDIFKNDTGKDSRSFNGVDSVTLGNRYETVTTTDNIISVRTHATDLCIVKDVLDNVCKKVCRLVSWSKFAVKKYRTCFGKRERKKQQKRHSYHINRIKRMKRLINQRKLYHENKQKSDRTKQKKKEIYRANELLRQRKCDILRQEYRENDLLRQRKCDILRQEYRENDLLRQRKCDILRQEYRENDLLREKKCNILREKYQKNELLRQKKCCHLKDIYQGNENARKRKCEQQLNRYQSDENFQKRKCEQLYNRYQTNELVRQKKCTQLRETYKTNSNIREQKKKKSYLQYIILEKRQHKLFSLRQKYRNNLQRLENAARKLLNTYDTTNGPVNQIELFKIVKETKTNQIKLYATMAKQIREKYLMQRNQKKRKLDFYEEKFREYIQQMPKYVCTVCHRCMFQTDVKECHREKYKTKFSDNVWSSTMTCFTGAYVDKDAFDSCKRTEWICTACHNILWKGGIPPRSVVANNMVGEHIPDDIRILNDLERHLIALRLPFMKMISLPKGGQKGCKGPVICVPSEVQDTANILPRHPSKSAFIRLKLKRRLNYRGWYKYQMICPDRVRSALRILCEINENYKNIKIDDNDYDYFNWDDHLISNLSNDERIFSSLKEKNKENNENEDKDEDVYGDEEDDERDPRKKFSIPTDTCLQSNIAEDYVDFEQDVISIAPAEKNRPASLLREKGLEAKAFPHLFPDGKNTYDQERERKLKFSTYANQRLFSADYRYASDPHYIFFLQYLNDIQHASSGISLQLRKSCSKSQFTLQNISDKKYLSNMLKKDMIFKHLLKVRGSPQYWSSTLSELFAMIRQLGVPTWFCSFSAADARWIDLLHYLADYHNIARKNKYTWNETNYLLKTNPVIVSRIFDRRFRSFMRNIILSKFAALGEVSDYFYRVEFQKRGSPHIHMIVWIKNAPKYRENSDEEVITFIDKYITCKMPNEKDLHLYKIIKEVQTHSKSHSKSCKRRNKVCRFYFPKPISRRTFIVNKKFKVGDDNDDDETDQLNNIKTKLKEMNIYLKDIEDKNIVLNWNHFDDSLVKVGWSYDEYERALENILPADTVVLKRAPEDRWVNNYNEKCILNWNANMDIQYVMNAYACGKYMLSYICKAEKEMSDILKNVHQEAKEKNISIQEEMKVLSGVYFHHREVCVQEAIYRVCSLKLKQASRKVEFVPTDPDCFRLSKPLNLIRKMIAEGREDNDDILYSNFMDKYLDRPDNALFDICLADFVAKFGFINKKNPRTRVETWPLKTLNFAIYKRKREAVIRYPRIDINDDEEKFYHNLMRLFLPIRKETDIQEPYSNFFHNGYIKFVSGTINSVKKIVLSNRERYESKISKQLEEAVKDITENNIPEDAWGVLCAESELQNEEISDHVKIKYKKLTELDTDKNPDIEYLLESKKKKQNEQKNVYEIHPTTYQPEKIRSMLKNMTHEQLNIFYYVRDWCLRKRANQDIDCLRLFITGGAGTGKSHLLKCIYYEATKILNEINNDNSNEIRTLICAPTNAAALNMNCTTMHSTFKIGMKNFNLSENILNTMRSKLDSLCLLFIDEISLVDQSLWRELHTRLSQITCKTGSNIYFGNVSIVAVGDFYQLPPVKGIPLYLSINVIDYWQNLFEYSELTICQRTKEADFYALANRIRKKTKKETFSEKDRQILQRCVNRYNSKIYQDDCLHLFAWNKFVNEHNENMLSLKCKNIVDIPAKKIKNTENQLARKRKKKLNTCDYEHLRIAVNARIVIEENANRDDGIVKGAFGNVVEIVFDSNKKDFVDHIRIKFDNPDCGRQHQKICEICRKEKTVCIQRYNNPWDEDGQRKNTEQFPIRLGWASTIHKVQGLTVKSVVIDLKKFNQTGQGYVAFTRPPKGEEVYLTQFKDEAFFCDERIEESTSKMRKMSYQYAQMEDASLFRIGFHNVEGLEAHYDHIKNHHWYKSCHIICINETWLKSCTCQSELENFTLITQNRSDSYSNSNFSERDRGGVGIFIHNNTYFEKLNLPLCDIESLTIKTNILNKVCFVTTVYKPPHLNSKQFITNFDHQVALINDEKSQHIIVGDFNEDTNQINTPIHNYFKIQGFKKLDTAATTIGNTSLDCIFIKNIGLKEKISIIPAYFSYHNALMLELFETDINSKEITSFHNHIKKKDIDNLQWNSIANCCSKKKKLNNRKNQVKRKKTLKEIKLKKLSEKQKKILEESQNEDYIPRNSSYILDEDKVIEYIRALYIANYNSWYSYQDIQDLLEKAFEMRKHDLLRNNRYVYIFTPILGTNIINENFDTNNELFDAINAFQRQRYVDSSYAQINELIIPLNVDQLHWILLIIVYPEQANNAYYVFYFDPLGQAIPEPIVNTLMKCNFIQNENQIQSNFQQILQRDGRNCGPWLVVCATNWLETKEINMQYLSLFNIEHERKCHESYLYDVYLARHIEKK
ncbi:unnamed protein product [Rotaria sp. Silwood1]|nr:unnamed protein product [Rotaria sp. Silwood1]CAF4753157.1 unnamed protein product [Rotaria sp. Silwood1]